MSEADHDEGALDRILETREAAAEQPIANQQTVELLIFSLSGQLFAFRGAEIREILPPSNVYFVPGCPPEIEGVVSVRGEIESVMSISGTLGLGARQPADHSSILVGQAAGMRSGVRVDEVLDVVSVPEELVQSPHGTLPAVLAPFVVGAVPYGGAAVAVLDLERIFGDFLGRTGS